MKLIPLTQGKFAKVDDDDYDYLMQFKWYLFKHKDGNYYARRNNYSNITKKQNTILMHRDLMKSVGNLVVDHKDHDGLNNQKINLRCCSQKQNNYNTTSRKNSTSKYLGVSVKKVENKKLNKEYLYWAMCFIINKNEKVKKYFPYTEKGESDAALMYNNLANKHYGEFANLNIIE